MTLLQHTFKNMNFYTAFTYCFLHGSVFAHITGESRHVIDEDGQQIPGEGVQQGHGEHEDEVLKRAGHTKVLVVL
jgi:hypothetical protein